MYTGPNIITTGLVYGYDTGIGTSTNDVATRLYPGEPTTNLLGNPSVNAYPTLGNTWATYNTNQYGSGTYFSIGTVSSISNNIVTMTSNHGLRTFDVMQPQSSGGGVTGGTNYFIKKISNTQFSLHAYNSSQDGTQGYIDPATGFHKVHESIAYDQRISINSSGFPTMWWGYPHLPNSGLVKELIYKAFEQPNGVFTDCLRQHITRAEGVDGMAYGADGSFTPNSPINCSFWARAVDSAAVGKSITFYHYTYGVTSPNAYSMAAVLGSIGEWKRFQYTFTSPNNAIISYWFPPGGPFKYDIANIQIEQKNRATPFTVSSRSATQALIDAKRATTINLSNVSFNSSAQPIFDGTNDYIALPNNTQWYTNDWTWETVIKFGSNSGTYQGIVWAEGAVGGGSGYSYLLSMYNQSYFHYRINNVSTGWANTDFTPSGFTPTNYNHLVWQFNNGTTRIYINGTLVHTNTSRGAYNGSTNSPLYVGARNDLEYDFAGEIPVLRFYNRTLTASEIAQNFLGYRRRFNI